MGGGFRFILLQHLQRKLVIAVHSHRLGKQPNTLRAEWGIAREYAAAISGRAGGNLAFGGLRRIFFGRWSRRGASSVAVVLWRVGGGRG
jgi:hypothetical protein